jgi:hypothetical protein
MLPETIISFFSKPPQPCFSISRVTISYVDNVIHIHADVYMYMYMYMPHATMYFPFSSFQLSELELIKTAPKILLFK